MSFTIIRNHKSDALTLHATSCTVAVRHYGARVKNYGFDTRFEAIESVAFHGAKVQECKCAKVNP